MHLHRLNRNSILVFSIIVAACNHGAQGAQSDNSPERLQSTLIPVNNYPHARWRLANPVELDHVVLWVSQIVIRHRDAHSADPAFAVADWHSPSPGGQRSRTEAFAIAREVREQAARDPGGFAELVQRHSEDIATQPLRGSLGGIMASQLVLWPQVLDALAATPPGQVSQVVDTPYGFHILLRRAPPHEDTVSGAHIVIAHEAAGWINVLGRGEVPARSRADALIIANQLYERAKEKPEEFSQLIQQYSEHRDASRDGDMGTWSTREPTYYPREMEILASLSIGEVGPPLDSPVGFQIIQRTPNRVRHRYAMQQIRLLFDPLRSAPDPTAKASVLARATQLSLLLREEPSRFAELQRANCCDAPDEWIDGRGSPALTNELSRLQSGQIAREPVQSESSYVIPKRIEPPTRERVVTTHELPEPNTPDILALVSSRNDSFLKAELRNVGDEVLAALTLPEPTARQVADLHRGESRFESLNTAEMRVKTFNTLLDEVRGALGPDMYPRYLALVNAHFERILLQSQ